MTTKTVKIIGLCSASFLAGIGTGYLIGKRRKKEEKSVSNHQEETFNTIAKNYISNDKEFSAEAIEEARKLASMYMEHPIEVYEGYPDNDPYPAPEEDPYEEEHISILPYTITEDQYYNEKENVYDKVTLLYYSGDDTLVDENEEVVPNRSDLIGPTLYAFTTDPEESASVIYVRNEAISCDFNIQHVQSKFSDYIGLPSVGSD